MAMTPICPKCGSILITKGPKLSQCLEGDCEYSGPTDQFKPRQQAAEHIRTPPAKWRDPVAMSMDGYDE